MRDAAPNFANRTLYHGDNLEFLRGMNSGAARPIAADPPFNKDRDFHATPDSLARGRVLPTTGAGRRMSTTNGWMPFATTGRACGR